MRRDAAERPALVESQSPAAPACEHFAKKEFPILRVAIPVSFSVNGDP